MGAVSVRSKPEDLLSSAAHFVTDFARISGRKGAIAALFMILAALLDGAGVSLLVPLLGLIFGSTSMPGWLRDGAGAAFALFGAHTLALRLSLILALFGALLVLRAVAVSTRDILIFELQLNFVETQQLRIARGLAAAKWDYLARFQHARLTHLMSGDVQRLGTSTQFVLLGVTAAVMVVTQWMLAFALAPALAALLLVAMIAGAALFGPLLSRARALGGFVEDWSLSLVDSTTQFLGGLKLAVSQDLQTRYVAEIGSILRHMRSHQVRFLKQRVISHGAITLLFGLFGAVAVMVGLLAFRVSPPLLVALLLIVTRMTWPIGQIQQGAQQCAGLLAIHERMLALQSELASVARNVEPQSGALYPEGEIVFENVFALHANTRGASRGGLRGVNLAIEPGEFLAITGASGAGKTTFADLLAGLYPAQTGRIAVGGSSLEGGTLVAWRKGLAYVSQDPFLFHDTIRANLAWANPSAREEELWQALHLVGADRFVRQAEGGLDAIVGDRGTLVSGGERQRIALARAVLRRPRLLLLDEATNALDGAGEREVFESLRAIRPRPTIVLIAHRAESLFLCDRIVRLDHGRIMELHSQMA